MPAVPDVARIRFQNAMRLFDEFVQAAIKTPDAATLRGLERRFAERLQIQPSYWSQIKAGSRQIGERLARQFEQLCRKPVGWMDQVHQGPAGVMAPPLSASASGRLATDRTPPSAADLADPADAPAPVHQPQDDDERFIVGLVLTYYRRHPARARTRLLDLLGEVLVPAPPPEAPTARPAARPAAPTPPGVARPKAPATPDKAPAADDASLWARTQASIAPLKRRR